MKERNRLRRWACGVFATVVVLTALAVAAGWRARTTEQLLERADAEMERDPKRALAMLDSLDRDRLCGAAQEAKFALLYTQAQDKNYIDETNDSLIRAAADYFESHGEVRDRFRALYYRGRVHVNRGEYSRAMIAFMEAEMLVGELDDCYLAGLLYTQIGDIYKRYYDYPKALHAYKKAYAYYLNTNRELHQYHALLDVALIHRLIKKFAVSENLFSQVLAFGETISDPLLQEYCYGNLIVLYNDQQRFKEATSLYDRLLKITKAETFSSVFLASLACMYAHNGDVVRANEYLKKARQMAVSQTDSIDFGYYSARILIKTGNYRDAYHQLAFSTVLQDSVLRQVLQQPILSTQRDFLANKLDYQAYRMRIERRSRIFYLVTVLFVVSALFVLLYARLKHKDAIISRSMAMYNELLLATQHSQSQMEMQIHELFKQQFKLLNELGEAYYAFSAKGDNKERIYQKVLSLLKPLKDERSFYELEAIIDRYHSGVMQLLRNEFPKWKEEDFHLLCYRYAGFSANMISVVTAESINNVYKRISRLRCRIRISDVPHRDVFLRLFDK